MFTHSDNSSYTDCTERNLTFFPDITGDTQYMHEEGHPLEVEIVAIGLFVKGFLYNSFSINSLSGKGIKSRLSLNEFTLLINQLPSVL